MIEIIKELGKPLDKNDIEFRVASASEKGFSVLMYKTARVDMQRLDECCTWSNSHYVDPKGNVICRISVYDKETKTWVSREDTGSESMTEKEKGAYSDSFKRTGFRWGIGRELYNAPFIWISGNTMKDHKGKYKPTYAYDPKKMFASEYDYKDGKMTLEIKLGSNVVFSTGRFTKPTQEKKPKPNKVQQEHLDYINKCRQADELTLYMQTNKETIDPATRLEAIARLEEIKK